ncbi:tripartite tricarboxylate transporter substrate binding protein [Orrella sp. NBD-18]|uniref:Tripartite tricarboxylate transporter substrate binding protein n=2 Tax=Sheuella amnicola TaxID=2707330 RepID=A0A6B2R1L5_9BURK|nr:tripartite tricarboxylate transporter substrate binding protein [Sheuella amnicola]
MIGSICTALTHQTIFAQTTEDYPNRPITIVVPFTPGGVTDITTRLIGQKMSEKLNQTVIIENKPGAGGNIAASYVARSPANGYTLFLATIGTHAINQNLYKTMPYDGEKDFAPLSRLAVFPNLLVVPANSPYQTVSDLIIFGKNNPGKLTFGSPGNGTSSHLSGELFKLMTGVNMEHIPYKGSSPANADLISGQISLMFDAIPSASTNIKANRTRALAITSKDRNALLPEIPTLDESGVKGYELIAWVGLVAPAGTPQPIVDKLYKVIAEVLASQEVKDKLLSLGANAAPQTPKEFAGYIKEEAARWRKVISEAKISINN